jgi:hypothetical protein
MSLREFVAEDGRLWQVWDTHPASTSKETSATALSRYLSAIDPSGSVQPALVREHFQSGWLTFTSGAERRRLAPIPSDWQTVDDMTLMRLLTESVEAPLPKRKPES